MFRKRLGYKRDRKDPRDRRFGWARPGALERPSDLSPHIKEILDQGSTNTCVANAIVSAIAIRLVILGLPWRIFSRLYAYWFGRTKLQRFVDGGSFPREVLRAFAKTGSPPESKWPFDSRMVNKRPPFQLSGKAVDLQFSYERCIDNETIAEALLQGCPVVFGMPVDRALVQDSGPDIITSVGKPIGRHMMTIVGNDPERRAFKVLNSYGLSYRILGYVWISWDVVDKYSEDKWAIK